jgi:hypothetical protein
MDIAGLVIDGASDDLAHGADDRGVLILVRHLVEDFLKRLRGLLFFLVEDFVDGLAEGFAVGVIEFEAIENVTFRGGDDLDAQAGDLLERVDGR